VIVVAEVGLGLDGATATREWLLESSVTTTAREAATRVNFGTLWVTIDNGEEDWSGWVLDGVFGRGSRRRAFEIKGAILIRVLVMSLFSVGHHDRSSDPKSRRASSMRFGARLRNVENVEKELAWGSNNSDT
jgi:hypothetical protein